MQKRTLQFVDANDVRPFSNRHPVLDPAALTGHVRRVLLSVHSQRD